MSSRAKILADAPCDCDNKTNHSDNAENHRGMEGRKSPSGIRRELRMIFRLLMRRESAILDKDKDSVGDCISTNHCDEGVPKALHPSNENKLSDRR